MNKLTAKEILDIIEANMSVSEFAYEDYDSEELGLGEIKEVDQYGGEGKGDTWYSVKYFADHDVYIKTDGFYSSYNGTEFYDGYGEEVKPIEKTIIEYI